MLSDCIDIKGNRFCGIERIIRDGAQRLLLSALQNEVGYRLSQAFAD